MTDIPLIDIPFLSSLSNMDFKRNRSEQKFCNIIIKHIFEFFNSKFKNF